MAKTPFEVRLSILEIAKDLAVTEWQEARQQKVEPYNRQVDHLSKDKALPEFPALDPFPSTDDVLTKAKAMYSFVTDTSKSVDTVPASLVSDDEDSGPVPLPKLSAGTIRVVVEGPDKSGKGHVIALLAHVLKEHNIECLVQGEYGRNASKMFKVDSDLFKRIKDTKIAIMGLQTSR
jgi:hypothetical protein